MVPEASLRSAAASAVCMLLLALCGADAKWKKPRCANTYWPCAGRISRSLEPCCNNPKDECRPYHKGISVCLRKKKPSGTPVDTPVDTPDTRGSCEPDGSKCKGDRECCNHCIEVNCVDSPDSECYGECAQLVEDQELKEQYYDDDYNTLSPEELEEYESPPPPAPECTSDYGEPCLEHHSCCGDALCAATGAGGKKVCQECLGDDAQCSKDEECCGKCLPDDDCVGDIESCPNRCADDPAPPETAFARGRNTAKCPGKIKKFNQVCHKAGRKAFYRRCKGKLQCRWRRKWIKGRWRWRGVCHNKGKIAFRC